MKNWIVTYSTDKVNRKVAVVKATTYTMALLQFMIEYPNCEYTGVFEVLKNESAML